MSLLRTSDTEADGGHSVGVDPRDLTAEQLESEGKGAVPVLRAIRAKCLDCSGEQQSEVLKCVAVSCALWAFRMGTNPYRKEMSEEQRAASAARMRAMRDSTARLTVSRLAPERRLTRLSGQFWPRVRANARGVRHGPKKVVSPTLLPFMSRKSEAIGISPFSNLLAKRRKISCDFGVAVFR